MGLFETNSSTSKTIAVLDIRSGSVGSAIVVISDKEKPEVLWSHRKSIPFLKEHKSGKLITTAKQAIDDVSKKIQKASSKIAGETDLSPVQEVLCFFAAPWYLGSTQTVTINKDNNFVVNEERMNLARQKALELFMDRTVENHTKNKEELEELDEEIFGIWCNGYRLDNPQNISTDEFQVSIYLSMLPTKIANITRKVVGGRFNTDQMNFSSFTAAISKLFTKVFEHPKSFLLVDAGEDLTEIILIKNDVLIESASFPLGGNFLIRTVAESLGRPPADARSRLRTYLEDHHSSKHKQEIDNVIKKAKEKWQDLFSSSIGDFSSNVSLPSHAYVLPGHSFGSLLAEFVSDASVKRHLITRSKFRVHEVSDDLLSSHLHTKRSGIDHYSAAGVLSFCEAKRNKA